MKTEPTTVPNVNAVNAIQDLPGFLWTIAKLKMKKWSSQWTQFMQLRKEAPQKIQDVNGVWTRDLAIAVRCSTN